MPHLPLQGPPLRHKGQGRMAVIEVIYGVILLLQTVIGILGNSSLLYRYMFLYFSGCKLKCTDLFLKHLLVANLLTLLVRGVPHTIEAFGWKVSLGDVGCKILFYLHRISRGVSIGSTCALSVFQAITISPRDHRLAELKAKAHKYVGSTLCLFWILYGLVNIIFLLTITETYTTTNFTSLKFHGYCSSIRHNKITESLYAALLFLPDGLCVGLMLWTSSFMVSILHRHKQQMRHIHRTNVSSVSSPVSRATKTILLLVSTYVCFYTLSCTFQICWSFTYNPSWLLVNTSTVIAGLFSTVSPFLLLSCDARACMCCFVSMRKRKSPIHIKNG
ncbi:vomeronasal type-1 receptor 4-like [Octodon degus]|uniref:Vomeronasal type-1 receptor n=1 Tax=Octodon degus TaxID=10160 RepID=A0A6P3G0A6_OCTDE|nr:vomeronasal type-1 receptor 4-like [Octodon degus]